MTRRDRILLTALVPLLVLAAAWFLAFQPVREEARRLDGEIATAQARLAETQAQVARSQGARRDLRANLRQLAAASRAAPAESAMPALLRQLEAEARRNGVRMTTIATTDAAGNPPVATPAPAAGTTPAPAAGTTPAPAAGTTPAPAAGTTPAPAAGTTPAPAAAAGPSTAIGAPLTPTPVALTLRFEGPFSGLQRYLTRLDRFVHGSHGRLAARGRLLSVQDLTLTGGDDRLTAEVAAAVYVMPQLRAELEQAAADVGQPVPGGAPAGGATATGGAPPGAAATPPGGSP